jgi:hypothetical protein
VVWAECKEGAGSGDQPDKGALVVWVITLMNSGGEDLLETKAGLQKHKGRLFSGRSDHVEHRHAIAKRVISSQPGNKEKSSHRIKKPLAPQRVIFWEGCCRVDVVPHPERYDFAIRERLNIEVVYATVIRGLPLEIFVIWTICGE